MVGLERMGWGGGRGGGLRMLVGGCSVRLRFHYSWFDDFGSWIDSALRSFRAHDPQPRGGVYQADISIGPLMVSLPFLDILLNPPDSRQRHPEDLILMNC